MPTSVVTLDPLPHVLPPATTPAEGPAHWKRMERTRLAWYGRETRRVAQHFAVEGAIVEHAVRNATAGGAAIGLAEAAVNHRAGAWRPLLQALYEEVAIDFARKVDAGFKHAYGPEAAKGDDRVLRDLWVETVQRWLASGEAATKVRAITETTRQAIVGTLRDGVAEGEGIPQLARRVKDTYVNFTMSRAVTIARTETIAASNLGSRAGALYTGLTLEKFWIATSDRRTREWHDVADGQTTPMDEPYVVRGERLMFPGDGSLGATASNLIMCRCVEGYRAIR